MTGNLNVGPNTSGSAAVSVGTSANPGFAAFFLPVPSGSPAGTLPVRTGYLGFSDGANNISMTAENGWGWHMTGKGFQVDPPTTFGAAVTMQGQVSLQQPNAPSSAVRNDDGRFPASVTGLRKGAGAGSTDTAAVPGTDYLKPSVPGVIGDGTTDNTSLIQAAMTAAGNASGAVHLPCGVFKVTAALSATIAQNNHVEFSGDGVDCTTLYVAGAVNGPTFNYGGIYSSSAVHDITIMTDQSGSTTGLKFSQATANQNPALAAPTHVTNVNLIGTGGRASSAYFGTELAFSGVSNVFIDNIGCEGLTTSNAGTCILLDGSTSAKVVAGVFNIKNVQANFNNIGVYINDYIQGVTIESSNFTSGGSGVAMNGNASGYIDQVAISNSQFGNNAAFDVQLNAPAAHLGHVGLVNNYFIEGRTGSSGSNGGVYIVGGQTAVTGNHWLETVATSQPMLSLVGLNAAATGNTFVGGVTGSDTAISVNGTNVALTGNIVTSFTSGITWSTGSTGRASGNVMTGNTTDYVVPTSGSSSNVVAIDDLKPRLISQLFSCTANTIGSRMSVVNANAPAYGAAFSGTGSSTAIALCGGSSGWTAH